MTGIDKITEEYSFRLPEGVVSYDQGDTEEIQRLLTGRKVIAVEGDHLELDNGTVVRVVPNIGGCSCGAGDYELKSLRSVDNIITRVEVVREDEKQSEYDTVTYYRIFVFAENEKINLLTIEGDDGNGYYGTGFELFVRVLRS